MGDRANIAVESNGKRVYLYTHWCGYEVPNIVAAALSRGKDRWKDASYLARILFCELISYSRGDNIDNASLNTTILLTETTGFGISAEIGDNSYPLLVVNCDNGTISFENAPNIEDFMDALGLVYTFEQFVSLKEGQREWSELALSPSLSLN